MADTLNDMLTWRGFVALGYAGEQVRFQSTVFARAPWRP